MEALSAVPLLLRLQGLLGLAALAAVIIRRQVLHRYPASAAWPGGFEDLHRAGLFAVVLLGIVLFATDSMDGPDPEPAPTPARTDATDDELHH